MNITIWKCIVKKIILIQLSVKFLTRLSIHTIWQCDVCIACHWQAVLITMYLGSVNNQCWRVLWPLGVGLVRTREIWLTAPGQRDRGNFRCIMHIWLQSACMESVWITLYVPYIILSNFDQLFFLSCIYDYTVHYKVDMIGNIVA